MISLSHTPSLPFSVLINVWNLRTSQSLICLIVAFCTRQLVIFCDLLVGLNLSDLFSHNIPPIFFFVSLSHVSLLFTIVYLGFSLHFIDFCDIFSIWRFSCESRITSLYLSVFGILFARNWLQLFYFIFLKIYHFFFLILGINIFFQLPVDCH